MLTRAWSLRGAIEAVSSTSMRELTSKFVQRGLIYWRSRSGLRSGSHIARIESTRAELRIGLGLWPVRPHFVFARSRVQVIHRIRRQFLFAGVRVAIEHDRADYP